MEQALLFIARLVVVLLWIGCGEVAIRLMAKTDRHLLYLNPSAEMWIMGRRTGYIMAYAIGPVALIFGATALFELRRAQKHPELYRPQEKNQRK